MSKTMRSYKLKLHVYQADLSKPYTATAEAIKRIYTCTSNMVVCDMAIHYMCESVESIENFASLVAELTEPGMTFMFTCYDGGVVFDELRGKERVESYDANRLKYSIIKNYTGSKLANYGQQIKTLLGFTDGQHRAEWLVNVPYLLSVFKRLGFSFVKRGSFDDFVDDFSINF